MGYSANQKSTGLDTLDNTTIANSDLAIVGDVSDSGRAKGITWTNLKAFLKTYFDTLYPSGSGTSTGTNTGDQNLSGYATLAGAENLTNKRITKRAVTVTQSATPTINTDNTDVAYITGLAQAVTSFTTNLTGAPVNGDVLILDITDDGTGRALSFGSKFEASGTIALPSTTVSNTKLTIGFRWNVVTSKWTCVGVA